MKGMQAVSARRVAYYPDKYVKEGFWSSWRDMAVGLVRSRELIWRLFLRDFNARYRQSLLGAAWAVAMPLVTVGMFVYLNNSGVLRVGDTGMPYPVFALIGITVYGLFSGGVTACSNSLTLAEAMVAKINFPKVGLVIAAFGQVLVDFLVRVGLLAVVLALFGVAPSGHAWLLPLVLAPFILLTLGLGMMLSLVSAIVRDVSNLVAIGTMFLLFLTPVMYPMDASSPLVIWNPVSHFIIGCRELIIRGHLTQPGGLALAASGSLLIFLVAWRLFYLAETKVTERI